MISPVTNLITDTKKKKKMSSLSNQAILIKLEKVMKNQGDKTMFRHEDYICEHKQK